MVNVVCTIENKDSAEPTGIKSITVTSVNHGYRLVAVTTGDNGIVEIDGKELIAAVENCMHTN